MAASQLRTLGVQTSMRVFTDCVCMEDLRAFSLGANRSSQSVGSHHSNFTSEGLQLGHLFRPFSLKQITS